MSVVVEGAGERTRGRRLFLGLLLVFLLGSHGYVDNPDAEVELQTARAIWLRGSAGLAADLPDTSAAERLICQARFDVMRGVDGRWYSWFGLGHALLLVPFYAVGRGLAALFPDVELRALEAKIADRGEVWGRALGEEFWAHLLASLHSPLFGAGLGWLLFQVLGWLGVAGRRRLLAALLGTLTTQLWPGTRESMADTSAGFLLLFALERALAWRSLGGVGHLVSAGALAGFAVLARPFHVLVVGVLALWLLGRGWRALVPFALGALPFAVWLLLFNWQRFGSVLETGYSAGTSETYWRFPFHWGFVLLGLSPGKGVLVFNPLLWLAPLGLVALVRRERGLGAVLLSFLLAPWCLSSFMTGWHSSQAWACRYLTLGAALLVTVGSADLLGRLPGRPVLRRALVGLALLGFAINLGGVLAPYRGFYDLGRHAWAARWPDAAEGDRFTLAQSAPRLSPTFGQWVYAWLSLTGDIPAGSGGRVFGALYGSVPAGEAGQPLPPRPLNGEDWGFRHLWPIGLRWRLGSDVPLGAALALAALGLLALWRWRRPPA